MKTSWTSLVAALLLLAVPISAFADYLVYNVPAPGSAGRAGNARGGAGGGGGRGGRGGFAPEEDDGYGGRGGRGAAQPAAGEGTPSDMQLILTGRITVNAGVWGRPATYTFAVPGVKDPIYFSGEDAEYKKAPTLQQEFAKRLGTAGKDPQALMQASIWGLKKGLVREFYTGIEKILEVDKQHAVARRILEIRKQHLDQPLPDNPAVEQALRSVVKSSGMQASASNHFLLLSDVSTKPQKGERKGRPAERLDLLEKTYEAFVLFFEAHGVELELPRERMKAVLFGNKSDYDEFAARQRLQQAEPAGFWDRAHNISMFNDQATSPFVQRFEQLHEEWEDSVESQTVRKSGQALNTKQRKPSPDSIRTTKITGFLVELAHDNVDMVAVSRAAARQAAASTGLLPRYVEIPHWVDEGLATYFQTPLDGTSTGVLIGGVTENRLESFRSLEKDRLHSSIEFIAGDQIFGFARSRGIGLAGFGQSWALTHYLLEKHPAAFIAYCRDLGRMPPDIPFASGLLVDLFSRAFTGDRDVLFRDWRQYMQSLKTERELLDESAGGRTRS